MADAQASITGSMELWGWIPIFVLGAWAAGRIKNEHLIRSKVIYFLFGTSALWGIGVLAHFLFACVEYLSRFDLLLSWDDIARLSAPVVDPAYAALDQLLAPATPAILYFAMVVMLFKSFDWISPKTPRGQGIVIALVSMSFGYASFVAIADLIRNPWQILIYGGFGFGMLGMTMRGGAIPREFSTDKIFNLTIRREQNEAQSNWTFFARTSLIFVTLCGFWYKLTISETVLVSFYSASIGGLLAIIGFAALVFTFTFDTINAVRFKRQIAADTKSFQQAAMVVLVAAILGLVLANGPVRLDGNGIGARDAMNVGLFVCAFNGMLVAADSVLTLFKHVVSALVDAGVEDARANVRFDECRTPAAYSILSDKNPGLSELRNLLEDGGSNVIPYTDAPFVNLAQTPNLIIVMPTIDREVPASLFQHYGQVIERGHILLVLTDQDDYAHKRALLAHFGFDEPKFLEAATDLPVHIGKRIKEDPRPMGHIPVSILYDRAEGQELLMEASGLLFRPDIKVPGVAVARRFGDGWVVVFSAAAALRNAKLRNSFNFRVAHALLDELVGLLPNAQPAGSARRLPRRRKKDDNPGGSTVAA